MSVKQSKAVRDIIQVFAQIFMKYEVLQKRPVDLGEGINLPATYIHMIEAIGKKCGNTVTALSTYFRVTKGAVSQVVSKLQKDGYLLKTKQPDNDKNIIVELTPKGWDAFKLHEQYNQSVVSELSHLTGKYTEEELQSFFKILNDLDVFFSRFTTSEK